MNSRLDLDKIEERVGQISTREPMEPDVAVRLGADVLALVEEVRLLRAVAEAADKFGDLSPSLHDALAAASSSGGGAA